MMVTETTKNRETKETKSDVKKTTKEVAKKGETSLAIPVDCYGATDDIVATDLTIGRIAIMQSGSTLVKEDKARQGAIINLLDGRELGYKEEEPLEFIPIGTKKYWIEKNADTDEFMCRKEATSPNELEWFENVDGINVKRVYHHSFYVLLPKEIKMMESMPLELAFRSTEMNTAKKLSTFLFKLKQRKEASWNRVFELTVSPKSKDKHTWFGSDLKVGRPTTDTEKIESFNWYKTVNDTKTNITHQEETEGSEPKHDGDTEF